MDVEKRYPMSTVGQAHSSMWLATRDYNTSQITFAELEEVRAALIARMPAFESGAKRQSLDLWLRSTSAGLIIRQV
jgi:hypothetical protein